MRTLVFSLVIVSGLAGLIACSGRVDDVDGAPAPTSTAAPAPALDSTPAPAVTLDAPTTLAAHPHHDAGADAAPPVDAAPPPVDPCEETSYTQNACFHQGMTPAWSALAACTAAPFFTDRGTTYTRPNGVDGCAVMNDVLCCAE